MAAKPAAPLLARPALVLSALALLGGCAPQYTDAQACADLSTMVWPWQGLETTQVETVSRPDVPQISAFPVHSVRVAGMLDPPAGSALAGTQPVEAVFQCDHRGELLYSFGWVEPNMLARPELRINRVTAPPTS